jgi:hypothetical protein
LNAAAAAWSADLAVQCGQSTAIFIPLYEGVKATRDTT